MVSITLFSVIETLDPYLNQRKKKTMNSTEHLYTIEFLKKHLKAHFPQIFIFFTHSECFFILG